MKRLFVVNAILLLVFSFAGCNKSEEKKQLPIGHPGMEKGTQTTMPEMLKKERAVVVPEEVKAKWTAVTIFIEDRTTKKTIEQAIPIGSTVAVPNTQVTISVLAFLPDFRMDEKQITTASDKLNNPAAQVLVQEPGKNDWKGWLYSKHPDVHPFPHEKIGILLVGGIPK